MVLNSGCEKNKMLDTGQIAPKTVTTVKGSYKTVNGKELLYELDIPAGDKPSPIVLYAHSWSGNLNQLKAYSLFMAEHGIAGMRINYRRLSDGTTFENAKKDILDAVDFIRSNADKYNFDLQRFGLAGASAGAVLTSLIAQHTPECKTYVAFNGGFDILNKKESNFPTAAILDGMFPGSPPDVLRDASAIHNIRSDPPDTLLFHGTSDKTIDCEQAKRFAQAIINKGGKAQLELYEGREHGFFNPNKPDFEDIRNKLLEHYQRVFDIEQN
jgi:acetyl esterase/lipase